MEILDFVNGVGLFEKRQVEQALYLLFYADKEEIFTSFSSKELLRIFSDAGKTQKINASRIIRDLKKEEYIRKNENRSEQVYELVPIWKQRLDRECSKLWLGLEYIESNSEVLNEEHFHCNRKAINHLIQQINNCYKNHCFDACCILMRKLFETLLIIAYQKNGIDNSIQKDKGYKMLKEITEDAVKNETLKLSRNKENYEKFRDIGNYSAHNMYYMATIDAIDDIKTDYVAMMDELYQKGGLF